MRPEVQLCGTEVLPAAGVINIVGSVADDNSVAIFVRAEDVEVGGFQRYCTWTVREC